MTRVVAVVPARMGSSRFPGKPLVPIRGIPMVDHVRLRAQMANLVDEVVVATCDREIRDRVVASGGVAVMTSPSHERGTTRVGEAMQHNDAAAVVIVQGDEPLVRPDAIDATVAPLLERSDVSCTNLVSVIHNEAEHRDPDVVKAVLDRRSFLLYLTRSAAPFLRDGADAELYRQTGIMAFSSRALQEFCSLEGTPLERAESIDMLRWLEHGRKILAVKTGHRMIGVDRSRDVDRIERALEDDAEQREIWEQIMRLVA